MPKIDGDVSFMERLEASVKDLIVDGAISALEKIDDKAADEEIYYRLIHVNTELRKVEVMGLFKQFELGYLIDIIIQKIDVTKKEEIVKKLVSELQRSRSYIYQLYKFYNVVKDHQMLLYCEVPFRFMQQHLSKIESAIKDEQQSKKWYMTDSDLWMKTTGNWLSSK